MKPTKYQKGQLVEVVGVLTGTIRNIRFDDRDEPIYTINADGITPDGLYVARDCELKEAE